MIFCLYNYLCRGEAVVTTQQNNTSTSDPARVIPSLLGQHLAGHPLARGEGDAGGPGDGVLTTTDGVAVHSMAPPFIRE